MNTDEQQHFRLLARFEQIHAGLMSDDPTAEQDAREILRRVQVKGDREMLAQVFHGIILAWDEEQAEWERIV